MFEELLELYKTKVAENEKDQSENQAMIQLVETIEKDVSRVQLYAELQGPFQEAGGPGQQAIQRAEGSERSAEGWKENLAAN